MKTSERGIKDLILNEGKRNKAYQDTKGVWTIGVGHAATSGVLPIPKAGMVITDQEIEDILAKDLQRTETFVTKQLGDVPQHVFDGAVSFVFNTGGRTKSGAPATWFKTLKGGDPVLAEKQFMQWNKPPEILSRRKREADLIFRGKYVTTEPKQIEIATTPQVIQETLQEPNLNKTLLQSLFEFIINLIKGKK